VKIKHIRILTPRSTLNATDQLSRPQKKQ